MNRSKKYISFGKIGPLKPKQSNSEGGQGREKVIGFGSFGNKIESIDQESNADTIAISTNATRDEDIEVDLETTEMREQMGFAGFGKKSKQFNIEEMVKEATKTAKEITRMNLEEGSAPLSIKDSNRPTEDSGESDDELIGPPIPQLALQVINKQSDESASGTSSYKYRDSDEDSDSDTSETGDVSLATTIPLGEHITMRHGNKAVVALTADPAGARLATGSVDYEVRFWDFAGMDSTMQSFRSFHPCENHPVVALQYSVNGDTILVISGTSQAKVLDRDGFEILECVKGDQYINDMARTKGHTASLNGGCWHPKAREEFMTCSQDATCRLWTIEKPSQHKALIKCRSQNGLKTVPTTCNYSWDGNLVACGCADGSLQMWDHRKNYVNTTMLLRNAHGAEDISCLAFSYLGSLISTRSCDNTLKLWDMRAFTKPLHVVSDIFNRYSTTDCGFSPNDSMVYTGESLERGQKAGRLLFYDTKTFEKVNEIFICDSHVIKSFWHPKLDQIFVGCGNGMVKVYYDINGMVRGARLCVSKTRRKVKHNDVIAPQQIITPHALPLFRRDRPKSYRKQLEKDRQDPIKSKRPDLPIKSGQGGRVASSGATLSSYVIRNLGLSKRVEDNQDPREAILAYAKDAAENPYWVSPAYAKTQPKPIFEEKKQEEEDAVEEPLFKKPKT